MNSPPSFSASERSSVRCAPPRFFFGQVPVFGKQFWSWTRWGRLGEPGQSALRGPMGEAKAIKEFESKFKAKTGHAWAGNAADYPNKGMGKYAVAGDHHSTLP